MDTVLKKDIDMCTRPLFKKIIGFSVPLILTGVLQLLYNAADIIVVGQYEGYTAMAAVGSTGALVNLITNLFIGLSVGCLAATAKHVGANDFKKADAVVHTSILISIIGGLILAVVGVFISGKLLIMMDTPETVLPLSQEYLTIFFLGMPFNLLFNFGSSIMRALGDTRRPLYILSFAGIVNVVLNLVFVISFKMGVAGVAFATIISQAISAILVVFCLMKRKGFGHLSLKKLRIDKEAFLTIIKIGLPAGIQSTIFSLSNVMIQSSINSMGDIAMAGNAAAANLEGFVYVSMNSVSQAALAFTGQNCGAKKKENLNLILRQTTILVTIIGIVMGVLLYAFGNFFLGIYDKDPNVIRYGLERLFVVGITYFLCGMMEVVVGSIRGMGNSILPMIVSILGVCGIRMLWIYTVFNVERNLIMLYLSYPVSWLITTIAHFVCYFITKHFFVKKLDAEKANLETVFQSTSDNLVSPIDTPQTDLLNVG